MNDHELLSAIGQLLEPINERLDKIETDCRQTRVLVEKQDHTIGLVAEQYTDIAIKLERVSEVDDLRDRVRTLETVARNHTASLQELRKAE